MFDHNQQVKEAERPVYSAPILPMNARLFMLSVDTKAGRPFCGYICNMYFRAPIRFQGMDDVLLKMDWMMDQLKTPQKDTDRRKFHAVSMAKKVKIEMGQEEMPASSSSPLWDPQALIRSPKGAEIFYIQILYRQHSSWQGTVQWKKSNEKLYFRSALELMSMLNGVLPGGVRLIQKAE